MACDGSLSVVEWLCGWVGKTSDPGTLGARRPWAGEISSAPRTLISLRTGNPSHFHQERTDNSDLSVHSYEGNLEGCLGEITVWGAELTFPLKSSCAPTLFRISSSAPYTAVFLRQPLTFPLREELDASICQYHSYLFLRPFLADQASSNLLSG